MKVTYKFADGTSSVVEVSDEIGTMIVDSRREEDTAAKYAQRHSWSIDSLAYEGLDYASYDRYFENEPDEEEQARMVEIIGIYRSLSDKQKRRLRLFASGKTYREIAEIEKCPVSAIHESIGRILKKFEKFL